VLCNVLPRIFQSEKHSALRDGSIRAYAYGEYPTQTASRWLIGFVCATDAETAEKQVAKEHKISETLRNKLIAIRDDL
jgi:hypothetical protein